MAALPPPPPFPATPETDTDGTVRDVRVTDARGRQLHLAGRGGPAAEAARAVAALAAGGMPVFVGAGLGAGIAAARKARAGPIFVCDRLETVRAATGVGKDLTADADIRFVDDADPAVAVGRVTGAARQAGFARLAVIVDPACARLDPQWCQAVRQGLGGYDALRERLTSRRFTGQTRRVLLLRRPYFLYREIEAALSRLGVAFRVVDTGRGATGREGAVADILAAVAEFRPDMGLTVNHLGLDREGRLTGLLADIGLPLASWFVDSPRLILHDYAGLASPLVMVFSYDADSLAELRASGFSQAAWLPLATDPERFRPLADPGAPHPWRSGASFVGAAMVGQAAAALARLGPYPALARELPRAAAAFAASPEKSARRFLTADPGCAGPLAALPTAEARLDAELALTWEATRRYRQACVKGLLPFSPLVVGDAGWETALPGVGRAWRRLPGLDYYDDLPGFYPRSAVNLNTTSLQMKGAVNQRVFDAPAAGAFVLTDAREQLGALFDPARETAVYADPGEIPDMVRHYLARPGERSRIAAAARARVLAEHTYDKRLASLLGAMQKAFGG
ncbi:MAG: glycosyltransferase [Solidesulfovibrio sp.]|uniref:glycosyltransferase family protein n=1 Tax=Solidesulfovibrio sp. TaxID=2910990 RepID=UPI002B1FB961|nr:glycosyltransferase [Solidesulfovibrio sp.]MEA4858597.1 glycosyltransferase [Solidesulfovibrio sp.]